MNSGVEDAFNLAWKLDYALRGLGGERLLNSYSIERRSAALKNQALANRAANFMTPPTRGSHLMRDAVLSLSVAEEAVRALVNPRQATFIPLSELPLNYASETKSKAHQLKPGDALPNLRYASGGLYDLLDGDFSVVVAQSDMAALASAIAMSGEKQQLQVLSVGATDDFEDCRRG